jgi:hypothetical protein
MRCGSFVVKKVFAIMVVRWDDSCDLASREWSDASRASSPSNVVLWGVFRWPVTGRELTLTGEA